NQSDNAANAGGYADFVREAIAEAEHIAAGGITDGAGARASPPVQHSRRTCVVHTVFNGVVVGALEALRVQSPPEETRASEALRAVMRRARRPCRRPSTRAARGAA
ncbi:hypothetical protein C9I57_31135, partial [Trinickia symbiotica]